MLKGDKKKWTHTSNVKRREFENFWKINGSKTTVTCCLNNIIFFKKRNFTEAETQRLRSNAIIATQNNEKAELQKKNDELHRKNADLNIDLDIAKHRISDLNLKINAYKQKFGILDSTGWTF